MGYRPFRYGEQLNPDKLNEKFDQVFKLLSKAYVHNTTLKRRLDMMNSAFEASTNLLTTTEDNGNDVLVYDTPDAYKFYDMAVGDSYEMHISGHELVSNSLGNITSLTNDKIVSDGHSMILATKEGEEVLSRIPLSTRDGGELFPSLGVQISSDQFDANNLGMIVSPSAVWGETINNSTLVSDIDLGSKAEIDFLLPSVLTPYLNTFKVTPVPGVKYRLYYHVGESVQEATSGWTVGTQSIYIQKDVFGGTFRLDLWANPLSVDVNQTAFAVSRVEALYNPFADTGISTGTYTFQNASNVTITGIETGVDMTNLNLKIYDSAGTTVLYDSSLNGFPYPATGSNDTFDVGNNTIQYRFEFTKNVGSTPEIPYLKIKYKETT